MIAFVAPAPQNLSGIAYATSPGGPDSTLLRVRATFDPSLSLGPTWLQIFENNSYPNPSDTPVLSVPMIAGYADADFGSFGRLMAGACSVALSSDPLSYQPATDTSSGTLTALFDIQYL